MREHHFPFKSEDMKEAVLTLKRGGVILYPTDTVWGLGCDATNPEAVARIYAIKQRAENKAMIVLANNDAMISQYVEDAPDVAWDLIEMATRPTTVIFSHGRNLAHNLTGEDGSVAFRLTKEEYSSQLCFHLRRPIVSTSANISGQPSPRFFREISEQIKQSVDYIAQYRREDTTPSRPSTIISLGTHGEVKIIRK